MKLSELLHAIAEAEKKGDVLGFEWKGIELWPVFRHHCKLAFKHGDKYFSTTYPETRAAISPANLKIFIGHYLRFKKHLKRIGPLNPRVLFFSKEVDYTEEMEGKSFNRFFDPLFEDFSQAGIFVLKMGLVRHDKEIWKPGALSEIKVESFDYETAFRSISKPESAGSELEKAILQMEELSGLKVNHGAFRNMIWRINLFSKFFSLLFKKVKPGSILLVNYDSAEWFGLIRAARKAGIPTADIQHGKQGKFHPAYSHFTKIPEGGYSLLPDFFWNWGKESAKNIQRWLPEVTFHKPVIGGNRWLGKWLEGAYEKTDADTTKLQKLAGGYKRVILFSMQPIPEPIPRYVQEAIENGPDDYLWLIRKHPRQSEHAWQNQLADKKNIEIEISSNSQLYPLLMIANRHITCWSSVAFEAQQFKVPTLIVHPYGKDLYSDEFHSALTSPEILEWLKQESDEARGNYIEFSRETALNAIKTILG